MKIEGQIKIDAPIAVVWNTVRDPKSAAACIPGCQEITSIDDKNYKTRVSVALGPIKVTFDLLVEVIEERPPEYALTATRGEEGKRASSVTAKSEMKLVAVSDNETELLYSSEVTLVGRLANYGLGLLRKRAEKLANEFADNLRKQIISRNTPDAGF